MMILETYFVSGTLEREIIGLSERFERRTIYQEAEAVNAQAAADSFEIDGYEWIKPPTTWLVTEATKMERSGQPSLFPLDEGE